MRRTQKATARKNASMKERNKIIMFNGVIFFYISVEINKRVVSKCLPSTNLASSNREKENNDCEIIRRRGRDGGCTNRAVCQ
jgi:hypothetical protein